MHFCPHAVTLLLWQKWLSGQYLWGLIKIPVVTQPNPYNLPRQPSTPTCHPAHILGGH